MKALIFASLMFLSCLFISFASHKHQPVEKKEATHEVALFQQQQMPKLMIDIARKTKLFYTGDSLFFYERGNLICPD